MSVCIIDAGFRTGGSQQNLKKSVKDSVHMTLHLGVKENSHGLFICGNSARQLKKLLLSFKTHLKFSNAYELKGL